MPNRFAIELLKQIVEKEPSKNSCVSPVSLYMALSMAANGSVGITLDEFLDMLRADSLEHLNKVNQGIMETSKCLSIANALFVNNDYTLKFDFREVGRTVYDALVREANFSDAQTIEDINTWVLLSTYGKIDNIVSGIDPLTLMCIVNAVYFKQDWAYAFEDKNTKNRAFNLSNGEVVGVPTMYRKGYYEYILSDDLIALRMHYKDNAYMTLYAPKSNISDFIANADFDGIQNQFKRDECNIFVPKFKMEYDIEDNLKTCLMEMGLTSAFDQYGASFDNVCNERNDIYISKIKQKTFIEVNEAGTEAAAATAVTLMLRSCVSIPQIDNVKIDRPFVYTIQDEMQRNILFAGVVENPL